MPEAEARYTIVGAYDDGAMLLEQGDRFFVLGKALGKPGSPDSHQCDPELMGSDFNRHAFEVGREIMAARELFARLQRAGIEAPTNAPFPPDVIRLMSQYLHVSQRHGHLSGAVEVPGVRAGTAERLRRITGEVDAERLRVIAALRERIAALGS